MDVDDQEMWLAGFPDEGLVGLRHVLDTALNDPENARTMLGLIEGEIRSRGLT